MNARNAVLLTTAIALAAGCHDASVVKKRIIARGHPRRAAVWAPATLSAVNGVPIAALKSAITQRLAAAPPAGMQDEAWKHTRALYKSFGETPLWLTGDGLATDRVRALTDAVLSISGDAMRLDAYPIADLSNALAALKGGTPTAEQWANADVLLSATYAGMGEDLMVGQIAPKTVGQSWHIDPNDDDVDSALVNSMKDTLERGIADMRPPDEDYKALQKELERYRGLVTKAEWPHIPAGKALHVGQKDSPARIDAVRQRLEAEGYTVGDSSSGGVYTAPLADAVGEFQKRHAITVDKALSPETVNALNVPMNYRLGQIAANLERYRWLPRTLGSRYIYVNVPTFQLTAYDSGEKVLEMRVIVGQEYEDKATPVFSDSMETVVFRPYWNITPDIQAKEIEPKLASDPGYLDRENMEYYSDGGVRRIRQKPGGKNALGMVKFLFPNNFNIYLHDTPNHELFSKDVRAFSHGCIRVEKPSDLAQWVLGWDAGRVDAAMNSGPDNTSVRVHPKIPVYITYGTAFVRDGVLYFGNDLYHRDDKLVSAVANGALPSPAARAALESLRTIAGT